MARPPLSLNAGFLPLLPTSDILDMVATRLDPAKVGDAHATIAFVFPGRSEQVAVTVANGVLTHRPGAPARADAMVTVSCAALLAALPGAAPLAPKVASGEARVEGDQSLLARFAGWFDRPDPNFAIVAP